MEGRTIVRPDQRLRELGSWRHRPSMEGRTIVRPDCPVTVTIPVAVDAFNGGPDNRPARLVIGLGAAVAALRPSMEGRTIVRPDSQFRQVLASPIGPSMEGRTIVRPDISKRGLRGNPSLPSMEGRTIVRPDLVGMACAADEVPSFNGGPDNRPARRRTGRRTSPRASPFNGGPDNRPARHFSYRFNEPIWLALQWRAGQSSGQTCPTATYRN